MEFAHFGFSKREGPVMNSPRMRWACPSLKVLAFVALVGCVCSAFGQEPLAGRHEMAQTATANQYTSGQIQFRNNDSGSVTIRLYHPKDLGNIFTSVSLTGSQQSYAAVNDQRIHIGGDWRIQALLGNGIESQIRRVDEVGGFRDGVWTVDASNIANPRGRMIGGVEITTSVKYQRIRQRFLQEFLLSGHVAEGGSGTERWFADQTLFAGFALLNFAGEARLVALAGGDPRGSEDVIRTILNNLRGCQAGVVTLYDASPVPGFFLRDHVLIDPNPGMSIGGFRITKSDYTSDTLRNKYGDAAMSLDQLVYLFVGWWAVSHWSTDAGNVQLARSQADAAINYLIDKRFMIEMPGASTLVRRGSDVRAAAGFLCRMASQITNKDYFQRAFIRTAENNFCRLCNGTGLSVPDRTIDMRQNAFGQSVQGLLDTRYTYGNQGKTTLESLEWGGSTITGTIKVLAKHFWGSVRVPDPRPTDPLRTRDVEISASQTLPTSTFHFDVRTHVLTGNLDLGEVKLGTSLLGKTYAISLGRVVIGTEALGRLLTKGVDEGLLASGMKRCPVCGGKGKWEIPVAVSHAFVLSLDPAKLLNQPKISVPVGWNREHFLDVTSIELNSFADERQLGLACMCFESAINEPAFVVGATQSFMCNNPWAVALRAVVLARPQLMAPVVPALQQLHQSCPPQGPSTRSLTVDWATRSRWIEAARLKRGAGNTVYNGLDFLTLEVLLRLGGYGDRLPGPSPP